MVVLLLVEKCLTFFDRRNTSYISVGCLAVGEKSKAFHVSSAESKCFRDIQQKNEPSLSPRFSETSKFCLWPQRAETG